ncbi:hypothetical protein BH10BAC2_BH10BAC2_26930 [soil metagenome]
MKSLAQIKAELTPEKLSQIDRARDAIDRKNALNLPLTEEEREFECEQRIWAIKSKMTECEDEFFREFMLKREPGSFGYSELTPENHIRFGAILLNWDKLMRTGNLNVPILKAERIEFRYELWQLKKQIAPTDPEFNLCYLRLLEWSKFRSIAVKRIFRKNIRASEYTLSLNNKTIIFNYESLTHIIARHFGHGMKPYFSDRDHFYGIFAPEELHLWIEKFFSIIDQSNLYANDLIDEINLRYKGKIYRINSKTEIYYEQGKRGAQTRNCLTTFFQLNDANKLKKLHEQYSEKGINKEFSVFVLN